MHQKVFLPIMTAFSKFARYFEVYRISGFFRYPLSTRYFGVLGAPSPNDCRGAILSNALPRPTLARCYPPPRTISETCHLGGGDELQNFCNKDRVEKQIFQARISIKKPIGCDDILGTKFAIASLLLCLVLFVITIASILGLTYLTITMEIWKISI